MSATSPDRSVDPTTTLSIQSLLDERHTVRDSTLHRPAGSGQWTGNFRGTRRGHGTDFDDLRHYSPGDELRHIDWNASARTNTLHTRLYREEREHRVTLITDLRQFMFTGTRELRSVRASLLTARLLWQAIENGSRVCVIIIGDSGLAISEHASGHPAAIDACALLARRFQAIQTGLDQHQDKLICPTAPMASGREASVTLARVAHWLSTQRQLHGTAIWLSGFDRLGTDFNDSMEALSQASRQVAIHIDDAMLDNGLPAGHYGYRSGNVHARVSRAIALSRKQATKLQQQLLQQKRQRSMRFARLLIPLLSSNAGNTDIVASLRQSGHLP